MTTLLIISLMFMRLTVIVFSQLLEKVIFMTLCTKEITCDKAGFKSRFCQVHQVGKNKIGVNQRNLCPRYPRLNISSCSYCLRGEKICQISVNPWLMKYSSCLCVLVAKTPRNLCNLWLINDLRLRKITYEIINFLCKTKPISKKSNERK